MIGVQAAAYLNKLPATLASDDRVLITDPMLATGEQAKHPDLLSFKCRLHFVHLP